MVLLVKVDLSDGSRVVSGAFSGQIAAHLLPFKKDLVIVDLGLLPLAVLLRGILLLLGNRANISLFEMGKCLFQ